VALRVVHILEEDGNSSLNGHLTKLYDVQDSEIQVGIALLGLKMSFKS